MSSTYKYDLSIIIPVYNNEDEVYETVIPILKNRVANYEIIFVNDGSSDNSQYILENIKINNPEIPITIYTQKNQGVSVARNKGIELSRGRYLFFCDADDQVSDFLIEKMIKAIKGGFDFIFWQHNIKRINGMQYLNYEKINCTLEGEVLEKDAFLGYVMQDRFRLCMGTFAICKDLLQINNISYTTDCHYGEDLEFILKVIMKSQSMCCIQEELYTYVRRETSTMGKFTLKRFDAPEMVLRLLKYVDNEKIQIADYNKEYMKTIYFLKQFIYSMESCLQHLGVNEYRTYWKRIKEEYPNLVEEGTRVLRTVSLADIGYTNTRVRIMKWNIYFYSFCIMAKNSLSKKVIRKADDGK